MSTYNGHRSWNAWNVSLWINNDEALYRRALELIRQNGKPRAAFWMAKELAGQTTPDGARYNVTCIRAAMRGM